MDKGQQKILIVVIVLANIALWGFFIFPSVGMLIQQILNPVAPQTVLQNNAAIAKKQEPVNFLSMRDPFLQAGKTVTLNLPTPSTEKPKKTPAPVVSRPTSRPLQTVPDGGTVQKTYVSQFKLKSAFILKNRYLAIIEEASHYGSGSDNAVPYSYRFGTQPDNNNTSRSQTVMEGDVVQGERVVKIQESYMILEKNGLYYKLTFNGGFQVKDPN